MSLIAATTEYPTKPGKSYVVGITDYSGHTTTLEYYSPGAEAWVLIAGTSATANFGGTFSAPSRLMRVTIASGTGSVDAIITPKR